MEVGQKVYVTNSYRSGEITEEIIDKIGNKYFYLKGGQWRNIRFGIRELCNITNYPSRYRVYLSMQNILDEREIEQLLRDIRKKFDFYHSPNLSLDQLRRIMQIINE